jgi:RNA polymerase sigma factor (sigma-70 family)
MTDYELVCKAKTDQKYMYTLYKKYEPLIQRNYKTYIQINKSRGFEFNDYMNEAYLILHKAIKSFKEAKVNNPDRWDFTSFFKKRLLWNNLMVYKKLGDTCNTKYPRRKDAICTSLYAFIDRLQQIDTTIESVEHSLQIEDFLTLLTSQEKLIMKNYLIPGTKSKIPSMREVGERMGISKQRVSLLVKKMRVKWQSIDN